MRYQIMEESPYVIYHLFYMIIESKTKNKKQKTKKEKHFLYGESSMHIAPSMTATLSKKKIYSYIKV